MIITQTFIKGLFILDYFSFKDSRGEFVKTIHSITFEKHGLEYRFDENFFSISNRNVIRGMHFQIPPDDHAKLVYLVNGKILDVVVDIRKESETYGKYFYIELTKEKRQGLYIGKGLAHGFLSLEDESIVEYHTTTPHSSKNETGIHYQSFEFDWSVEDPVVSERDLKFPYLRDYNSPF